MPSKSFPRILTCLALFLLAARPGLATVAVMASDEELTKSSRLIVQGQVRSMTAQWSGGEIYTYVELDVQRVLKGRIQGRTIVIKQPGGTVGELTEWVHGAPAFEKGKSVLLFLDTWDDGALRVARLFMGKYDLVRDPATGKVLAERKEPGAVLLPKRGKGEVTRSAEIGRFRTRISAIIQRQTLEEPVGAGAAFVQIPKEYARTATADRGVVAEPFTLLVINNRYHRWFQPDNGQGIGIWFDLTQQPNGNAHASLQAALDAWNNVETSKIQLDFAGYIGNGGGASRNFFSAISFEDPLNQIRPAARTPASASSIRTNSSPLSTHASTPRPGGLRPTTRPSSRSATKGTGGVPWTRRTGWTG